MFSLIISKQLFLKRVGNNNPFFPLYYIYYNNKEIGFFNYLKLDKEIILYQFELNRQYRRKKIGSQIIRFLESYFRSKNYDCFKVIIVEESLNFWKKNHFIIKNKGTLGFKKLS